MSVEIKLTSVAPNVNCVIHTPDDTTQKYPLLVFYVGKGEFGSNIAALYTHGPAKFLKTGWKPQNIVIACVQNDYYWVNAAVDKTNKVLDELISKYPCIDATKIFGTGLSAGGSNWMTYGFTSQSNANRILGYIIQSGQDPAQSLAGQQPTYPASPVFQIAKGAQGWGICGTLDSFWAKQHALFTADWPGALWTDFPGQAHSAVVWDTAYDPNWKSPTTGGSIYDWVQKVAGNVAPPVVYESSEADGVFITSGCADGTSGSTVEYIVAAGAYQSSISQADADSKAVADVSNNGQAYANANGSCIILPAKLIATIEVYSDGSVKTI